MLYNSNIKGGEKMKYYEKLLSKACFNLEDVCILTGNKNTANSLVQSYLKKGYVQSVKRNLYVAINLADNAPVANRYLIGSHITDSAYISHHSACLLYTSDAADDLLCVD